MKYVYLIEGSYSSIGSVEIEAVFSSLTKAKDYIKHLAKTYEDESGAFEISDDGEQASNEEMLFTILRFTVR